MVAPTADMENLALSSSSTANSGPTSNSSFRVNTENGTHVVSTNNKSTDEDDATEITHRTHLEDYQKCSTSLLWKLMMSFYDRLGVTSWSQGIVPHFITCNAFIGRSYARVLSGFLQDCASTNYDNPNDPMKRNLKLDPTQPLYIIELGTGAGKFSFFMLKALTEMSATLSFPVSKIVYVMTDFTQSNFDYWCEHPMLKPFVESGQLDFAIFDAVNDTELNLHNSGVKLTPSNPTVNPICVVANYLFDTLCHDIFQIDNGVLKEGLISVGSTRESEPDILDPEIIKNLSNLYKYNEINCDYYKDTVDGIDNVHYSRILNWYKTNFNPATDPSNSGASLLFPIGALRAIRRLSKLSAGRAVVISGDKGNNNPDQFRGLMDPHIAVHGSFSVMVNYHAIGSYFTSRGGFALHNPQEEASLKVSTFVLPGHTAIDDVNDDDETFNTHFSGEGITRLDTARSLSFPNLSQNFKDHASTFGPNDFFTLQKCMKEDAPNPTLKSVVALLKLGDWDPDVFYKFRDVILNQVCNAGVKLRNDLVRGVERVWVNYYMLDKEKDVAFEIGRFYYGIRRYDEALRFYTRSSQDIGEHHVTYHNMGLCHYSLGNSVEACGFFKRAMGLNGNYEKAKSWLEKVTKEMEKVEKEKEREREKEREGVVEEVLGEV